MKGRGQPKGLREDRFGQFIFLGAIAGYLLLLTSGLGGLKPDAALFPTMILATAGVFVLLKAASLASPAIRRYLEPDVRGTSDPTEPEARIPPHEPVHLAVAWAWGVGAVAAMYAVGFLAGSSLAVLVYLKWVSRTSWQSSLIVTGATLAFAWLVFARAMHIELDLGLLGGLV